MASHGGIAGVMVACILYGLKNRITPWHLPRLRRLLRSDRARALGRLANFVNGELWGRPLDPRNDKPTPPWWSREVSGRDARPRTFRTDRERRRARDDGFQSKWRVGATVAPRRGLLGSVGRLGCDLAVSHRLLPEPALFQACTDGLLLFALLAIVWLRSRESPE